MWSVHFLRHVNIYDLWLPYLAMTTYFTPKVSTDKSEDRLALHDGGLEELRE